MLLSEKGSHVTSYMKLQGGGSEVKVAVPRLGRVVATK